MTKQISEFVEVDLESGYHRFFGKEWVDPEYDIHEWVADFERAIAILNDGRDAQVIEWEAYECLL